MPTGKEVGFSPRVSVGFSPPTVLGFKSVNSWIHPSLKQRAEVLKVERVEINFVALWNRNVIYKKESKK